MSHGSGRNAGRPGWPRPVPQEVVGGRRPALEAVRAGAARRLLLADGSRDTQGLRELRTAAAEAGIPIEAVPRARLDALGLRNHQGVAALVPSRASAELGQLGHPPPLEGGDLRSEDPPRVLANTRDAG